MNISSPAIMAASSCATLSTPYPAVSTPTIIPPSDPCINGYTSGRSEVLWTLPNTYTEALSIIGSYKNLTWSGNPPDTVALNGTDNTVGTSRVYELMGSHVIETILVYQKPAAGPYVEIHSVAPLTVPSAGNVSFYAAFDGTTVTSVCDGRATAWNLTASFCATNASTAKAVLDMLHSNDVMMVGKMLGGDGTNVTSCAAVGGGNGSVVPTTAASMAMSMASPSPTPTGSGTGGQGMMSFGVSQPVNLGIAKTVVLAGCIAVAAFML